MSSGSSTTGNILGAIGAVVGGIFGGPVGAAQGYAIGSSIGNAIDPPKGPTQEGPRLKDKSVQTSTYGATIPRGYGTFPVNGNVFWLEKDKLKEVVKKKKSGGKGGGGGATVKTYTYFATFAVGLCQGPIDGIRRIWIGPNLVYDAATDDLDSIIAGNRNIKGFVLYNGTEDQLPDSRMQADKGVSNTPSYRGLAYLVVKDLELTKYGNSLAQAQVKVEIVKKVDVQTTIFRQNTYAESVYNNNICSGSSYDSLGWVSYIYRKTSAQEAYQVRISPEGSRFETKLNPPAVIGLAQGVTEIAKNLTSYEYAFLSLRYISSPSYDAVIYGKTDRIHAIQYAGGNSNAVAFAELDAENVYILRGVSDPYEVDHATGNTVNNSISLPAGFVPWMASDGSSIYFCSYSGGTLSVRQYDKYLTLLDSYSISVSGVLETYTAKSPACIRDGVMSMLTHGNSSAIIDRMQIIRLDVEKKTAEVFSVNEPDSFAVELCGNLTDLGGVLAFSQAISPSVRRTLWQLTAPVYLDTELSEIVENECVRSGLISSSDIDATDLNDTVSGYLVASSGSIRNAIEPLRGAWPFDVLQDGYGIKFKKRGTSSVATIDIGELGVQEQIRESREMDSQIARKVVVKYLDKARDYDVNEQADQRENTEAVNTFNLDLPVVLSATEAKRVSQKLLYLYWLERSAFNFTLPPSYSTLQPSDVVTITAPDVTYDLRISAIEYRTNGELLVSAKANSAAIYSSIADTDGGLIPPSIIPLEGPSVGLLLDIPVIDETLQNTTGYVGYMTGTNSGWAGGTYWSSSDDGQTWVDLQSFDSAGTIGSARNALEGNSCALIQKGGSLIVQLYNGQLESITEAQMLNGANYAAYGDHGRWEIIRYQNAALNSDGSYTIDTFIRGDRGTEWASALHQSGDKFCLLDDPDGAFILASSQMIGQPRTLRAVTAGSDIDSAANESFTYNGVNLECYSPVHAKGVRDGSSNLAISWIRRTRIGGEWRSNVDASLGEATESYEIDVMSGATVKRTITSTTQSITYTASQQTADFGAPQSSVTVRIYQMSATVGRGYPLEVTL